jgi:hypothetical protein
MMARMQGALRRTPSPQQIFDGASKRVAAGVAAAGAFVGGALTSIREENRGDFEDHSRWSEEVESRNQQRNQPDTTTTGLPPTRSVTGGLATADKKRKTVVIVVSSESSHLVSEVFVSDHVVSYRVTDLQSCSCLDALTSRTHSLSFRTSLNTSIRMSLKSSF